MKKIKKSKNIKKKANLCKLILEPKLNKKQNI